MTEIVAYKLAAAKEAFAVLSTFLREHPVIQDQTEADEVRAAIAKARVAIAKATGETTSTEDPHA